MTTKKISDGFGRAFGDGTLDPSGNFEISPADRLTTYTVILLRPEYIADDSVPPDTFTTYEQAANPTDAVAQARRTACLADNADAPDDYALIGVYEGCLENLAND